MASRTLPALSESGLSHYLAEIRKFPLLEPQEEYMLAKSWREHEDTEAAHRLVTSHLRLVAKIAMGYRGYGLPINDVISEGNVGLMQAVKRFEPDRGFRLATYAMWWIRASIQEYVLRSWSLVKIGTTAAQKKLFFNLRRTKGQIDALEDGNLTAEHVKKIADRLGVKEDDSEAEWQDWLADDTLDQETQLGETEELEERRTLLVAAMQELNEREQDILQSRRLSEVPLTLEELSVKYGVSRERVRQIEVRAFEKLQEAMKAAHGANHAEMLHAD